MILTQPIRAADIAAQYDCRLIGDASALITGINEIHKVVAGDLTFCDHPKYFQRTLRSEASVVLITEEPADPRGKTLLISEYPWHIYDAMTRAHRVDYPVTGMVHKSAEVHPTARVHPTVIIGAEVRIGPRTEIGPYSHLDAYTEIGADCHIGPHTVIGTEGFYFKSQDGRRIAWYSAGHVRIEDDVWISGSCTIDRGVSGVTQIGQGTKIDHMVHLAHGVMIGKDCLIMAHAAIAGKVRIGDRVTIHGQVGSKPGVVIADDVTIAPQSGVIRNLEAGKSYGGSPAIELKQWFRELSWLRNAADRDIKRT